MQQYFNDWLNIALGVCDVAEETAATYFLP